MVRVVAPSPQICFITQMLQHPAARLPPLQPPPARSPSPSQLRPPRPLRSRCPTQWYLLPPPDVHPSRPSPLTYPPRSGVHFPQCPAPRPLLPGCPARPPASLPAVPRAADFSKSPSFPVSPFGDPQAHQLVQTQERRGPAPSVLCGRARPLFTPPLTASRPGDYNSQHPPSGGSADVALAPPLSRAPPPASEICARIPWREFGSAVEYPGVPGETPQGCGAQGQREESGAARWG